MAPNPNPSQVTDAGWWLMQQLLALQKGTANGGIYANKSGYHNTRNGNRRDDYSVVDAVDKLGPGNKAAAYDWTFRDAQSGRYGTIMKYTGRMLKSAKDPNDPRLNGWREFYGQADRDQAVEGWDTRYGYPATSDSSHLWHIHFSESRQYLEDLNNKKALLSVLRGETVAEWKGEAEMELNDTVPTPAWVQENFPDLGKKITVQTALASTYGHARSTKEYVLRMERESKLRDEAILAAVKGTDSGAIIAAINKQAAEDAKRDADLADLVEAFGDGKLDAEEVAARVVQILGERLSE